MAEPSKTALKNKKKRARKHEKAVANDATLTAEEVQPVPLSEATKSAPLGSVSSSASPVDLLKAQIEEAKATKDHKRAQALREQLWKIEDTSKLGVAGENAPETDTELLQQLVSNSTPQQQSKMASSSPGLEDRRLRTLQKKLRQIQELKEREAKGEKMEASQVEKIAKESEIRLEIAEMNPL